MEWVLEHDEVTALLVEAMKARGYPVTEQVRVSYRQNHKKGTLRVVVTPVPSRSKPDESR
jgi:hypothetical protein